MVYVVWFVRWLPNLLVSLWHLRLNKYWVISWREIKMSCFPFIAFPSTVNKYILSVSWMWKPVTILLFLKERVIICYSCCCESWQPTNQHTLLPMKYKHFSGFLVKQDKRLKEKLCIMYVLLLVFEQCQPFAEILHWRNWLLLPSARWMLTLTCVMRCTHASFFCIYLRI